MENDRFHEDTIAEVAVKQKPLNLLGVKNGHDDLKLSLTIDEDVFENEYTDPESQTPNGTEDSSQSLSNGLDASAMDMQVDEGCQEKTEQKSQDDPTESYSDNSKSTQDSENCWKPDKEHDDDTQVEEYRNEHCSEQENSLDLTKNSEHHVDMGESLDSRTIVDDSSKLTIVNDFECIKQRQNGDDSHSIEERNYVDEEERNGYVSETVEEENRVDNLGSIEEQGIDNNLEERKEVDDNIIEDERNYNDTQDVKENDDVENLDLFKNETEEHNGDLSNIAEDKSNHLTKYEEKLHVLNGELDDSKLSQDDQTSCSQPDEADGVREEVKEDMEDEDPGALTIDTGEETMGRQAPPLSQPPSDDDVDPDALTIDTPPEDSKKELKTDSDQEPSLTIAINSKLKKVVRRKTKNLGRAKGTKRKIPKTGGQTALRCPRCPHLNFSAVMDLLDHQRKCAPSQESPKIPRKVYMCSACGSYFENWDLFLHMKEMHKRNICLHCLGMFSQASKLSQHLATKHGVVDEILDYGDQLAEKFPGPQLLLCCRCDKMCTDQDFESHTCSTVCSHCGLSGTHYPTCRLAPPPVQKPTKTPKRRARNPKKQKKPVSVAPPTQDSSNGPLEAPSPADDLSPTTFNEKMMQLYRGNNRSFEKPTSTLESIEETINQVVTSGLDPVEEQDEEDKVSEHSFKEEEPENVSMSDPVNVEDSFQQPEEPEEPVSMETQTPVCVDKSDSDSDNERMTIDLEPRRKRERAPKLEPISKIEEPPADTVIIAGEETPYTCVPLPEPLDRARVPIAMKLFLRATSLVCVYCAHARKIAVNAKQLALHQLAQHRYVTIAESASPAEKADCHDGIVKTMKDTLQSLESVYFNAYGFDSSDKTMWRSADRVYECFHCSVILSDLRDFSQHNRKMHCNELRKTRHTESHLCIMCKTRFLTYSELLCHLCCGVYVPGRIIDPNCKYRCYCCDIEPLPSSFRLMVHLRLTHTACDMCFTLCDSQAALATHVQRHKSILYCYACGLTYETRAELSKHIFWKHGAESVTCKRCLQKKWRHAYHFCLPAPQFPCETCGGVFKTTSMLRVHQRLHTGVFPHACTECEEKFISIKLLEKHGENHKAPALPVVNGSSPTPQLTEEKKKSKKPKKDLRELFDLPPVNLSESDDSSEDEGTPKAKKDDDVVEKQTEAQPIIEPAATAEATPSSSSTTDPTPTPAAISRAPANVWDGVLASLEEKSNGRSYPPDSPFYNLPLHRISAIMLADHDYCRPVSTVKDESRVGLDHDYCNNGLPSKPVVKSSPRKSSSKRNRTRSSSSDSSSSSDGSCSCGSSCSCSSTSSTESASSGEAPKPRKKSSKSEGKSDRRKGKAGKMKVEVDTDPNVEVCEIRIRDSDLETDEPVTDDEEFYEQNPALRASEVLRLNRSMLLDKLENVPSPGQTTPQPQHEMSPRRKSKSKRKRVVHDAEYSASPRPYLPSYSTSTPADESSGEGGDGRRPRRKRVPLKFYGFSSGDEEEMLATPPRKKEKVVEHNTTIAASPTPIVAAPSPQPEPSNLWNPPSWRPPPVAPRVHPIKIKTGALKQTFAKSNNSDEFHIKRAEFGGFHVNGAHPGNSSEKNEKLYCFCQCPYDEVSEMIACDAHDCVIEWFHFECVGIMDPPKGKWYCPDCKKKAAAASEMMNLPLR